MTLKLFKRVVNVTIDTMLFEGFDSAGHIEKSLKPEPNTCEITLFNLKSDSRAKLEELRKRAGDLKGIPVKVEAGYEGGQTSVIWLGELRTVESFYERPDWMTVVGTGDGEKAHQSSRISQSMGPGTTATAVLTALAKELGLGPGNVATAAAELEAKGFSSKFAHGVVLSGQTSRLLTDWSRSAGLEWSIQDGALQFVRRGATMPGKALLLSSDTGLLGSPTVDNEGVMTCRTLMIPDVRPGILLAMDSSRVKGGYRVEKATWDWDTFGGPFEITIEAKRY